MAHQSLYRRYRPQRFSEVRGQEGVVGALRSAVADDRVGHAYLFSGPRGTGKTSTARILAKALNCEALVDGEPCGTCDSCVAIQAGTSYDLQELDAASNNKVEDVRSLIERVALGSPGRTKVYILDEVHMLSTGASNALLKTLEEPPDHVVFVLATTDPQKVLPTIRSRTQHFEFHLLPADELGDHVRWVISDAGLDVDDAAVEHVLRAGGGSARDTLSALDQAAAGGVSDDADHVEALAEAVVAVDTAAALTAVASATIAGRDPRVLGEGLLAHLRDVFLQRMGGPTSHLSDIARERVEGWAGRVTDRSITRALEEVGEALLAMRQAPDARIPLEVALVRITRSAPAAGGDGLDELVARVERLERGGAVGGTSPAAAAPPAPAPAPEASPAPTPAAVAPTPASAPTETPSNEAEAEAEAPGAEAPSAGGASGREAARAIAARQRGGAAPAPARSTASGDAGEAAPPPPPRSRAAGDDRRPARGEARSDPSEAGPGDDGPADTSPDATADRPIEPSAPAEASVPPVAEQAASPAASTAPDAAAPTEEAAAPGDDVAGLWSDRVVGELRGMTKALFKLGQVVDSTPDVVTVGLPNTAHLERCQQKRDEAQAALAKVLGRSVRLELVVGGDDDPPPDRSGRQGAPAVPQADEHVDLDDLVDAPNDVRSGVDRVTDAFPGARVVDQ